MQTKTCKAVHPQHPDQWITVDESDVANGTYQRWQEPAKEKREDPAPKKLLTDEDAKADLNGTPRPSKDGSVAAAKEATETKKQKRERLATG